MKKLILSLVAIVTISLSSFGQTPEGFKYQAVVRNASNTILTNQAVGLRMTIQQGAIGGTTIYSEKFAPTTTANGLVNVEIGNGTPIKGTFANINWANGPYYIETAVDINGGTNYSVMGTSQLMSVPYALYAKTSGNGQGPAGPQGIQGLPGTNGAVGATGLAGPQGLAGNDGAIGPQGPQGLQGLVGVDGTNGAVGATGLAGPQGLAGNDGATGPQGPQGLQGPAGNDGATGPAGSTGVAGASGNDGATGPQGIAGDNGAIGPQGLAGNDGVTGPQGPAGSTGAAGAQGIQGPQGLPGANGAVGATGPTGPQGLAGNDGATGPTGAQGNQGLPGTNGTTGDTGANGQGGVTTAGSGINVTGAGTLASPYVVSTTSTCGLAIGDTYAGGIIFFLDGSGCHGLVAKATNEPGTYRWSTISFDSWAFASGIYGGVQNTKKSIARALVNVSTCPAASVCDNLTSGGYTDWYLPSKDELDMIYVNLHMQGLGGFANGNYWSSTEFDNANAWRQYFGDGIQYDYGKNFYGYVRSVRAF